ncbi:hypothetical protein BDZ89DRAFT_1058134 [Hymenopellis radicata]|nr:hypothetical protein BDZ89DRAFT_1058134 [Hymenopellis radicata]
MYNGRPVVATAASNELRNFLSSSKRGNAYAMGADAVRLQIKLWEGSEEEAKRQSDSLELFGVDLGKAFNTPSESPVELAEKISKLLVAKKVPADDVRRVWTWLRLPFAGYAVSEDEDEEEQGGRAKKKSRVEREDELVESVDEWIIRNEAHLRFLSKKAALNSGDARVQPWTYGLVGIEDLPLVLSDDASFVPSSEPAALCIKRQADASAVPGLVVLGEKRKSQLFVQPSQSAFTANWTDMTDRLLDGLDWNNVFVAGGLVLGTFLTPQVPNEGVHHRNEWLSSDIDMYIYGLSVQAANDKIKHIAEVYQRNLPPNSPFLIVRNSQTITLYSSWPKKRVQIVLKLVKSPREVLLNFDLDPCAIGYDGTKTWMLPRFARALQTGTTIFTMDIINGHYLGDRKATRDPRMFKYANKGFGIRFLPSYLSSLSTYTTQKQTRLISRGESLFPPPLSLPDLAAKARKWTATCIQHYLKRGHTNTPFYWPDRSKSYPPVQSSLPVFSHAMLESNMQRSSEPLGRSCLTGFSLFMRHVALWEEEAKGKISIYDKLWAENTYGEGLAELAYDDMPEYKWDKDFNIDEFRRHIGEFNEKELKGFRETLCWGGYLFNSDAALPPVQRLSYGSTIDEVFSASKDLEILLVLSPDFVDFANKMIADCLRTAGFTDVEPALRFLPETGYEEEPEEGVAVWRLDRILNWQMMDRRIDEVREMLWAYFRANEHLQYEERDSHVMTQISKRAIRTNVQEEMEAFVIWAGRQPYHTSAKINAHYLVEDIVGHMSGLSFDDDDDDDDDE